MFGKLEYNSLYEVRVQSGRLEYCERDRVQLHRKLDYSFCEVASLTVIN